MLEIELRQAHASEVLHLSAMSPANASFITTLKPKERVLHTPKGVAQVCCLVMDNEEEWGNSVKSILIRYS